MLASTTIVCCLATAIALSLDSQRLHAAKSFDTGGSATEVRNCSGGAAASPKPVTRAAVCLAGNARTFGEPDVVGSLQGFLQDLQADRSCTTTRVDLFAYVTLTGDKPKEQRSMNASQIDASKQAVKAAFEMLNATTFEAVDEAGEVTQKNFRQYVVGKECFHAGYWSNTNRFIRSLNQLRHVQRCLQQVVKHEALVGEKYDAVIVARPDLIYNFIDEWRTLVLNTTTEGLIHHKKDWFLAMPRPVVDAFFDRNRSMPLTCRPGDYCCGKVQRSEDMFEYITEARLMGNPCTCRPCYCNRNFPVKRRSAYVEAGYIATLNRPPPPHRHIPRVFPHHPRHPPLHPWGRNHTSTSHNQTGTLQPLLSR